MRWCPVSLVSSSRAFRRPTCCMGRGGFHQLLRHVCAGRYAAPVRRLRPAERGQGARQLRRGQRADRQLRLFRQPQGPAGPRARHGLRRIAAGLPVRGNRWRALLGRGRGVQHPAGPGGGRGEHARHAGLPGGPVAGARRPAHLAGRSGRAAEGHPVFQPDPPGDRPVAPGARCATACRSCWRACPNPSAARPTWKSCAGCRTRRRPTSST